MFNLYFLFSNQNFKLKNEAKEALSAAMPDTFRASRVELFNNHAKSL